MLRFSIFTLFVLFCLTPLNPRNASTGRVVSKVPSLGAAQVTSGEALLVARLSQATSLLVQPKFRPVVAKTMPTIVREALAAGLHPTRVVALILVESSFNPAARSSVGAVGLMQLLPSTAEYMAGWVTTAHLEQPDLNVKLGIRYLAYLTCLLGDEITAIQAYNYGPTGALKVPKNKYAYAKKVLEFEKLLR